jgi:hypothetical protein
MQSDKRTRRLGAGGHRRGVRGLRSALSRPQALPQDDKAGLLAGDGRGDESAAGRRRVALTLAARCA